MTDLPLPPLLGGGEACLVPSGVRIARWIWIALLAIGGVNVLLAVMQDGSFNLWRSGGIIVLLAAGGVSGTVRLSRGQRSGRTLATTMGTILAVLQILAIVVLMIVVSGAAGEVDPDTAVFLAIGAGSSVVEFVLVLVATVVMFRRDVQAFLVAQESLARL